jgi:hypothetical protein
MNRRSPGPFADLWSDSQPEPPGRSRGWADGRRGCVVQIVKNERLDDLETAATDTIQKAVT